MHNAIRIPAHRALQLITIFSFWILPNVSQATDFPAQGRLFAGATRTSPSSLNTELSSAGFKQIDLLNRFGLEILFPVHSMIDVGLRYTKTHHSLDEVTPTNGQSFGALVDQDSVTGVARVSVLKSKLVRADAFVAFGGTNTSFNFKSASLDGSLTKREGADWFASIRSMYGVSAAVGHKNVYLVVELGMDHNNVASFKNSGTLNSGLNSIDSVDLSGAYATIGLLFDGITASSR